MCIHSRGICVYLYRPHPLFFVQYTCEFNVDLAAAAAICVILCDLVNARMVHDPADYPYPNCDSEYYNVPDDA